MDSENTSFDIIAPGNKEKRVNMSDCQRRCSIYLDVIIFDNVQHFQGRSLACYVVGG